MSHVSELDLRDAAVARARALLLAGEHLGQEDGIRLYEVSPSDESLESVFSYLVAA